MHAYEETAAWCAPVSRRGCRPSRAPRVPARPRL